MAVVVRGRGGDQGKKCPAWYTLRKFRQQSAIREKEPVIEMGATFS